jgi:hypothetical protein
MVRSWSHTSPVTTAADRLFQKRGPYLGTDDSRFSIASYAPSHSNSSHSTLIGPAQPSHYLSQPGLPSHARTLTTSDSGYSPTSTVDPMMHERMWDMIAEQSE